MAGHLVAGMLVVDGLQSSGCCPRWLGGRWGISGCWLCGRRGGTQVTSRTMQPDHTNLTKLQHMILQSLGRCGFRLASRVCQQAYAMPCVFVGLSRHSMLILLNHSVAQPLTFENYLAPSRCKFFTTWGWGRITRP